jgi:hypothetical protein
MADILHHQNLLNNSIDDKSPFGKEAAAEERFYEEKKS